MFDHNVIFLQLKQIHGNTLQPFKNDVLYWLIGTPNGGQSLSIVEWMSIHFTQLSTIQKNVLKPVGMCQALGDVDHTACTSLPQSSCPLGPTFPDFVDQLYPHYSVE